jgi:alpha-L-fucosidase
VRHAFLFAAALAALGLETPLARATGTNVMEWYAPAKVGLFLHWGMNCGTPDFPFYPNMTYNSVEDFEKAAASWQAETWVRAARQIHARYITIASFHSRLGFLQVWPSAIPGCPRTRRDHLGELVKAAHAEGIKVVVYMTTAMTPKALCGMIDVDGYLAYKRKEFPHLTDEQLSGSFKLDNSDSYAFGAYTYDVVKDLAGRYGVDGFWFDAYANPTWYPVGKNPWAGGYEYDVPIKSGKYDEATFARRYFGPRDMNAFVHALNPRLVTFHNNFPPLMPSDVLSKETQHLPDYRRLPGPVPAGATPTFPSGLENCILPQKEWAYDGTATPVNVPDQIKRIVFSIGHGVTACIAEGPMIDGTFPEPVEKYNRALDAFFAWAGEALLGDTLPGARVKGGFTPSSAPGRPWGDGAEGVALFTPDRKTHYLVVTSRPKGGLLSVPSADVPVRSAQLLKTGKSLPVKMEEGRLAIRIDDWRSYDADGVLVVKLR